MFKRVLVVLLLAAVLVVPGAAEVQDYYDSWGPYSTTSYGTGAEWHGPTYLLSMEHPVSDFEVSIDVDWSGNDVAGREGVFFLSGYSGDDCQFVVQCGDFWPHAVAGGFNAWAGSTLLVSTGAASAYGTWAGTVEITRTGNVYRVWRDGTQIGSGTGLSGNITSMTLELLVWSSLPPIPGFSVDSVYLHGKADIVPTPTPTPIPTGYNCTINIYDADTRLPLSGSWDYYVAVNGGDPVSGSASGAFTVVHLPATSILQPHLLSVTKEGYVQVPETLALNVPAGGREIPVYLRSTTAPPEEGNVWIGFTCTDADTGLPVSSALVNLDGSAQYTGSSGYVRFQVPMNSTHEWVASSSSHWPMGDTVTVGTVDLNVPVELVRKTSDLPRPPLPDLPNFPVIHPSLDPAGFRMQILSVPILGGLASPLLDTMDAIAVGLDDIVQPVLDFVTDPADNVVEVLESVGNQLTESVAVYTDVAGVLLGAVGKLLGVFPALVVGLVSYNLVLDLVYLLLRGGL